MRQTTLAAVAAIATAAAAPAQDIRTETLDLGRIGVLRIVEGVLTGDQIVDYVVDGDASQILSVDLLTDNPSAYFNILPAGSEEAIFIGSSQGTVADTPLPSDGAYAIRLYQVRPAARRGETAEYSLGLSMQPPEFADSLAGGPDYWVVSGVEGTLNLRAGPSTRYGVMGTLQNGEVLQNRGCRTTGDLRWCQIRATGSGVTGWVAGQYLAETAPPRAPSAPEGLPEGNGFPYDATGTVPCATADGQPMRQCPFGVIREGPGNAGVWIGLGDGAERQILFEGGAPVAVSPAADFAHERSGDLTTVRVGGERFEIPDAVVYGG